MKTHLRFPGFKAKAVTLSYDDGASTDVKMIKTLDKYGLKCTFNVNSNLCGVKLDWYKVRMSKDEMINLYKDSGHEVALHTLHHPNLNELTQDALAYEIFQDRINLEEMFKTPVRGMAYPNGIYNDDIVETLEACGVSYARTVEDTFNFNLPTDWLRIKPTCHHTVSNLDEVCDKFLNLKPNDPKVFYLWGHSYEFEQHGNWEILENFCQKMSGNDDIWYATNIEIYDYVHAYKRLRFTSDQKVVYNPNATPVWFLINKDEYVIKPNETLYLK